MKNNSEPKRKTSTMESKSYKPKKKFDRQKMCLTKNTGYARLLISF